jgi:hypothetical protein
VRLDDVVLDERAGGPAVYGQIAGAAGVVCPVERDCPNCRVSMSTGRILQGTGSQRVE